MIDVIVPVRSEWRSAVRTLTAAREGTRRAFRALVFDDSGSRGGPPDGALPGAFVFTNRSPRGFAGTVNRGLRMCPGDVIVLSPGTIVAGDWLEMLEDTAQSRARVATVTPVAARGGFGSPGISIPAGTLEPAARSFATNGPHRRPEIPIGLPFCLLLRRAALDAAGLLAERATFDERLAVADLSLRMARRGFHHLLDDRVLVAREESADAGGTSGASRGAGVDGRLAGTEPLLEDLLATSLAGDSLGDVTARARRASSPRTDARESG